MAGEYVNISINLIFELGAREIYYRSLFIRARGANIAVILAMTDRLEWPEKYVGNLNITRPIFFVIT